jgi:hypothetical protein
MITYESSDELFDFAVMQFSFLNQLGFRLSKDQRVATYSSPKFVWRIAGERYGDAPSMNLLDLSTARKLPSPLDALVFHLRDYEKERDEIEKMFSHYAPSRRGIAALAALCKRHPWVFTSDDWLKDETFLDAAKKTEEWASGCLERGTLPSSSEVIAKLRSFGAAAPTAEPKMG